MEPWLFSKPSEPAPWYPIPTRQAVSVEHPCLVKDVGRAIEMLGGDQAIKTFLQEDHAEKPIHLKFHPRDPFNQPILSVNCQTSNVLLKVTVPKRTGRKRKRGSNGPWLEDSSEPPAKTSAKSLLQSLRDNERLYQIEPVASIPTVHIFRTMPDFAYLTSQSGFLKQFRDKILPFQYPLLSDFQLDPARGLENTEVIPPPALSTMAYPSNYAYRQNPAIKAFIDPTTGSRRLFNTQAPSKIHTHKRQWDMLPSQVPTTVSPSAPPLESEPHNFRGLVTILRTIFARRPIWTRRGLANQLPSNAPIFLAKSAIGYVAYAMRSGPWRDCYIRLGVDPRSDRSYRKYQTLMLQLVSTKKSTSGNKMYGENSLRSWRRDPDKNSHVFTGEGQVPCDGKVWQLCDLHDPLLKKLVDIPDLHIREKCEDRYFGWYQNGTWCKLKIILKAKVDLMMEGITPGEDYDLKFDKLLALPEAYHLPAIPDEVRQQTAEDQLLREGPSLWKAAGRDGDPLLGFLPRNATKLELEWAAQYRALCRAPQGKLPYSGRLSKSKEKTRASYLRGEDSGKEGTRPDGMGGTELLLDSQAETMSEERSKEEINQGGEAGELGDDRTDDDEVGELELEEDEEDEEEENEEEEEGEDEDEDVEDGEDDDDDEDDVDADAEEDEEEEENDGDDVDGLNED